MTARTWFKSSYSGGDEPDCVEVAISPADTTVHTGHGDTTTIGAEAPHLDDWITRGH